MTNPIVREFLKCSNDYKYFKNYYLIQDNNSEAMTFICWILTFKTNKVIGFLTEYQQNGEQLIETIYRFLDHLPKWMQSKFTYRTKSNFCLENKNQFHIISKPESAHGLSFDYIIINNFSIFEKYKKYLIPVMRTNNYNKRIIYLI